MNQKRKIGKYNRQEGLCYYCKEPMNPVKILRSVHERDPTAEHLLPRCKGGLRLEHNIVLVHSACNSKHGRISEILLHLKRRKDMIVDDYITEICVALYSMCNGFEDAVSFLEEATLDAIEKYPYFSEDEIREKIIAELKGYYS